MKKEKKGHRGERKEKMFPQWRLKETNDFKIKTISRALRDQYSISDGKRKAKFLKEHMRKRHE